MLLFISCYGDEVGALLLMLLLYFLLWVEFKPESVMTWNKIDDDNGNDYASGKEENNVERELWFISFTQSHLIFG